MRAAAMCFHRCIDARSILVQIAAVQKPDSHYLIAGPVPFTLFYSGVCAQATPASVGSRQTPSTMKIETAADTPKSLLPALPLWPKCVQIPWRFRQMLRCRTCPLR